MSADPNRVLVAGDWHGNTEWAVGVIEQLPDLLPDEERRIVLHAGDFGIWRGHRGRAYLDDVSEALAEVDAELWFVDGNHEDHDQLAWALQEHGGGREARIGGFERPAFPTRCWWLPRGHRWTWHGRTWLALGGAVSVDHRARVAGRSWWPGETLQDEDLEAAINPGRADVVLAHDCPSSVPLDLPRPAPEWWDVRGADLHRGVVQLVADAVRPSWWIHGHYHLTHQTTVPMQHGDVQVTGLDNDGASHGAHRVLDVRTMTWGA